MDKNKPSGAAEISDLVEKIGIIREVKLIQQGSFNYEQGNVDRLYRFGFKPTDTVYEVRIEFGVVSREQLLTLEQLKTLADEYNPQVSSPERLINNAVKCQFKKSIYYPELIQKIQGKND